MAKNKSKHVESDAVERDELALLIQKELNKAQADGSKAVYFLDEDDSPSLVNEWVSTGSSMLDLAISNRPHGGLPVGRMVELSGLESTGKSLICGQIITQTQKMGGLAAFFDSESAVDRNYWRALGIKIESVPYIPFTTLEEYFTKKELLIGAFRKASRDRILTILTDSVTQASVEKEMESEHGVDGYNTGRAIVISKAMRKCTNLIARQRILDVYTNQVRYNMNAGPYGDKWIVPGGKALPFACSVRVRLANLGKIKKADEVIGMECQAQVIKNRCGPGYRTAKFDVHFDSGIQDLSSWLNNMQKYGVCGGNGKSGYDYTTVAGEKLHFKTPEFVDMMNTNAVLREEVYQAICDKYIMQYRDPNSAIIEDVEYTRTENDDITANAVKEDE